MTARVESIHLADRDGAPASSVAEVIAVPGRGLEGDRYFRKAQAEPENFQARRQVTLIEAEALEAVMRDDGITVSAAESRRNICTRGVALNHLVGRTFRVGGVTLKGAELCEPCGYLEKLTGREGLRRALIHRGGLRAEVIEGGPIRPGDPIETS